VQPWDSVPAFNQAHVRVEFQATDVTGTEVTAAGDATVWYIPWLFLLAIALVIAAIVGLRWWRNRRTPQTATDTSTLGTAGTPFPTLAGGAATGAASGRGRSGSHRKD
jgi:hypothetical protein